MENFMDKRESDWSSCIITSDDSEAELAMNVEDDADNNMQIMNSGREVNDILDDNMSISLNCYADKKYGASIIDLQSESSDINSGSNLWMHPAQSAQAYNAGNEFAKIKEDEIQYTDNAIDQLNNAVSDHDQYSGNSIHDIASPHHNSSSTTSGCTESNHERSVEQQNMMLNESDEKMSFIHSSPANHNDHLVPQMSCARQNLTSTPFDDYDFDLHPNGSIHSINSSQVKNRDENAASSSSSMNASTFGDDFETGFGDVDVEDAYHAIFGEEQRTPKSSQQRDGFNSAEFSSNGRNEEENNPSVAEAAVTLTGVKRPRRKLEGEISDHNNLDRLSCDIEKIEVLYKAGSIIRILEGEYCDWDGEILCVEDPRESPSKCNKGRNKLTCEGILYVVAPQYSDGVPLGNCFLIGYDGVAELEKPEDVQYTSVLLADTETVIDTEERSDSDSEDVICSTDDDCDGDGDGDGDGDDRNSCHGDDITATAIDPAAVDKCENVTVTVNQDQGQGQDRNVTEDERANHVEVETIDETGTVDENEDRAESEKLIDSQTVNGIEMGDSNGTDDGTQTVGENKIRNESENQNQILNENHIGIEKENEKENENNVEDKMDSDNDNEVDMETVETRIESEAETEACVDTDIDDETIEDPGSQEPPAFQNGVIDNIDCIDENDVTDDYDHTEELIDKFNAELDEELLSMDNLKQRGYWEVIETPKTSPSKDQVDFRTAKTLDDIKSLLESEMDDEAHKGISDRYGSGIVHMNGNQKEYGADVILETKSGSWTIVTPAEISASVTGFMGKDAGVIEIESKDTIEDTVKAVRKSPYCAGDTVLSTVKEDLPPPIPSLPPTAAQLRYAHYLAMKDLDLCSVGRRVRVVAEDSKYRTRYGIVVSVVDSDHFLISVTIVSPFDNKSPKDRLKGNMNGNGQPRNGSSSSCVCLYLSLKEFCFVD